MLRKTLLRMPSRGVAKWILESGPGRAVWVVVVATVAAGCHLLCAQERGDEESSSSSSSASEAGRVELPKVVGLDVDFTFPEELARSQPQSGAWLPVCVEISSRSPRAYEVVLSGDVIVDRKRSFAARKSVEVPPGATVRAWLYLAIAPRESSSRIVFRVQVPGMQDVYRTARDLGFVHTPERQVSLLVVDDTIGDLTPWVGTLDLARLLPKARRRNAFNASNVYETVDSLQPELLPDDPRGYSSVDMVVLRELGDRPLEPAQKDALLQWVHLGGTIVIAPNRDSTILFESELVRDLLGDAWAPPRITRDVQVGDILVSRSAEIAVDALEPLQERDSILQEGTLECVLVEPLVEDARLPKGRSEIWTRSGLENDPRHHRLYTELPSGLGSVGVLAFDYQSHRDASGVDFTRAVWEPLIFAHINKSTPPYFVESTRTLKTDIVDALRDDSRDIGLPILIGLIVVYIVLVGPGLYFLLKRFNRLPWIVWAEPTLAAVYVGVVFISGYVSKGVLTKAQLFTVISQAEDERFAIRRSYLSVFSADGSSADGIEYVLEAPVGELEPVYANAEEQQEQQTLSEIDVRGTRRLTGYQLKLWQQGFAVNSEILDYDDSGVVVRELPVPGVDDGSQVRVALTNRLPYAIVGGVFVSAGRNRYELPRIEAGDSTEVTLTRLNGDDDAQGEEERNELLRKARVLSRGIGRIRLLALLEREDEDIGLRRSYTLKDRTDVYVMTGGGR